MPASQSTPIATTSHNHQRCINNALENAQRVCLANNVRLTPMREKVLRLVWQSHKPLGAYDLLSMLNTSNKAVAPPTVYRALDFLQQQGLVHKIVSRNAFVGCAMTGGTHLSQFLLCRACGVAIELDSSLISNAVSRDAHACEFSIDDQTVEIAGLCRQCQSHD